MNRALFLDRDGTVIVDTGYPDDPDAVTLLPGAARVLRRLQQTGWRLAVISNQSGIGRGRITPGAARAVHQRTLALLAGQGVVIEESWYCPHAPWDRCRCRKPSPGMVLSAAASLGADLSRSVMVGDKPSDVRAGLRAGARGILLGPRDLCPGEGSHASTWEDVGGLLSLLERP